MFWDQAIQCTWNLKNLPSQEPSLPPRLKVREAAQEDDLEDIWSVIERSYCADQGWSRDIKSKLEQLRAAVFIRNEEDRLRFLLLMDGKRIVGASGVNPSGDPQIVTGICVVEEYRCRGYGTALLYATLKHLANAGLMEASAMTQDGIASVRHLCPKFGGQSKVCEKSPEEKEKKPKKLVDMSTMKTTEKDVASEYEGTGRVQFIDPNNGSKTAKAKEEELQKV
ncbi:MAG: GNAT family N-acetyltransferase [Verrucomicrobiota bacterium]